MEKKLSLINVRELAHLPVYWEIRIDAESWAWGARLYHRETNQVLVETEGGALDENEARYLSQTWVIQQLKALYPEEIEQWLSVTQLH